MYPVWGTWRLPPGMWSNYWNHSGTSELQSLQFYTFPVALGWHWHTLDILCINIIRYLLLYFSYRCVLWTWRQELYCYLFVDEHLMNRLLLSRSLVYFILPYICKNILTNIYPDDWRFAIGWKCDIFSHYHASHTLVIIRLKWELIDDIFVTKFSYIMKNKISIYLM